MSDHRARDLTQAITSLVEEAQLELVEATCTGTACRTHVHVFVHGAHGVDAGQLGRLHRAVEARIEETGLLTPGSYHLEVATPGVKRPLKSARDFERNLGREVHVFLDEPCSGKLELEGKIAAVGTDDVHIQSNGSAVALPLAAIRFGKLVIDKHFRPAKRKKKRKSGHSGRKAKAGG